MKRYFLFLPLINIFVLGCAKENLPPEYPEQQNSRELYIAQSTLSTQAVVQHLVKKEAGITDTSINLYNIALSGTIPAEKDIQLKPVIFDQQYVDSFNQKNNTHYILLPTNSYVLDTSVTIYKGLYSSQTAPIRLSISQLQLNEEYLLPLSFEVREGNYAKDIQRNTANFVFRILKERKGRIVGNIPEALVTNAKLFDFYNDLALRDASGKIWIYPLGSNNYTKIGSPVLASTGLSTISSLFFNPKFNSIMGTDAAGTYLYSYPITAKMPNPTIFNSTSVRIYWSSVFRSFIKDYHCAGADGKVYGLYTTSGLVFVLSDVDPAPYSNSFVAITTNVYSSFPSTKWWYANVDPMVSPNLWPPTVYKSFTVMGDYAVALKDYALVAYKFREPQHINFEKNALNLPIDKAVGILFSSYVRIFNIEGKHLIGVKNNGDIVLFEDFSVNDFYEGTNLNK